MNFLEEFKRQIAEIEGKPKLEEIGEVLEVKDGTVRAIGLEKVGNFELVQFVTPSNEEKEIYGVALNLEAVETGIMVLGRDSDIKKGDLVKRTKKTLSVPVGENLIGRIIDPLGRPLDEKGKIEAEKFLPLERKAPSVIEREPVKIPLHTGILAIDTLIPIGRGQRELILGGRGTGKTALVLDTILNQKGEKERPICIYVSCGQKKAKIKRLIKVLQERGAFDYTILVSAFADDPASFLFLAPYTGTTIGEYFRDQGKDALVIFDDLTKQAWAWREISLILRRPPGREAYPGDIFYLHSRLLERAAKISEEKGGGSLTALPIIEIQGEDVSGYIPTNVISICDGQITLNFSLFARGQKPAIDIGKSVSRVGSSAQTKAIKNIAATLKLELAQFQELERFVEFTEELDPETKKTIEKGRKLREILKQKDLNPLSLEKEVVLIFTGVKGYLDQLKIEDIQNFKEDLITYIERFQPEIFKEIKEKRDLDPTTEQKLVSAIEKVLKNNVKT